jgi:CDP-glycerol glycerophosphotransferase
LRFINWARPYIVSLGEFLAAATGWLLVGPITLVLPRRTELVVVLGRDGGKFLDNCKHLFVRMRHRPELGVEAWFLARDALLADQVRVLGGRSVPLRSWRAAWLWLRAGTIAVDSVDWMMGWRFAGSRGARVVQMWHGVPLKRVQLARFRDRIQKRPAILRWGLRMHVAITGRYAATTWFLSTSGYVSTHAFQESFRYSRISRAGYPRNDALFDSDSALRLVGVDASARATVLRHRASTASARVGVYAPTFREALNDPFADGTVDLCALSRAAVSMNLLLLVKLHPWMHGRLRSKPKPGLIFVSPESDIYPLLPLADFLITDYSSIYFDFLLLDRPILFFAYDLERYLAAERGMYFSYAEMTPGEKVTTLEELVTAMQRVIDGKDDWRPGRARVRSLVFEQADGHSADRLLAELYPQVS